LNADPDPATQINANPDTDPQPCLEESVCRPDDVAVDAGLGQDIWGVSVCSHQLDDKF
jgi:hypothetical protein